MLWWTSGGFEPVAGTPDGVDQGFQARHVELAPQVADVDIDHIRAGVEAVILNPAQDLSPGEHLGGVPHEQLQ